MQTITKKYLEDRIAHICQWYNISLCLEFYESATWGRFNSRLWVYRLNDLGHKVLVRELSPHRLTKSEMNQFINGMIESFRLIENNQVPKFCLESIKIEALGIGYDY